MVKILAMNDVLYLIRVIRGQNENGFQTEKQEELEIWGNIGSVKRQEFYAAAREGIQLDASVTINADDFRAAAEAGKKPELCRIGESLYRIFRTYQKNDVEMELILQEVE